MSAAMYDAWAVYDSTAVGFAVKEKLTAADVERARREAISYAAYRVLKDRYALSANAATTLAALDNLMGGLGYSTSVATTVGNEPAAVGNRIAASIITLGNADGSNQAANYADPGFKAVNGPLLVTFPGNDMIAPDSWQPLALTVAFTQNGLPEPGGVRWEAYDLATDPGELHNLFDPARHAPAKATLESWMAAQREAAHAPAAPGLLITRMN
jgi:hypothetical protein